MGRNTLRPYVCMSIKLAGPETWLVGPEAWLASPMACLAGLEAWLADPATHLFYLKKKMPYGLMDRWMNILMNGYMDQLTD